MSRRGAREIGRKTVSFISFKSLHFVFCIFFCLIIAFTGILTWQHRLWLLLSEFNMARNDASINANENYDEFKEEELKVFEVRNSCVAKAEYNYVNANLSTSIKICQELTDELRVSFN